MRNHTSTRTIIKHQASGNRIKGALKYFAAAAGAALCLFGLPAASSADTLIAGDIYVYTSPGVYADVTSLVHQDPIISINGQDVLVVPNYNTGVVYDGNGNVIGFIAANPSSPSNPE